MSKIQNPNRKFNIGHQRSKSKIGHYRQKHVKNQPLVSQIKIGHKCLKSKIGYYRPKSATSVRRKIGHQCPKSKNREFKLKSEIGHQCPNSLSATSVQNQNLLLVSKMHNGPLSYKKKYCHGVTHHLQLACICNAFQL